MNKLQVIENFCYKIQQKSKEPEQKITIIFDKQHESDILKDLQEMFGSLELFKAKDNNTYLTNFGVLLKIKFRKE